MWEVWWQDGEHDYGWEFYADYDSLASARDEIALLERQESYISHD